MTKNKDEQNSPIEEPRKININYIELNTIQPKEDDDKKENHDEDPNQSSRMIVLHKSKIQEVTTSQPRKAWKGSPDKIIIDPRTFDPTQMKIDANKLDNRSRKLLKDAIREYYYLEEDMLEPWQLYCCLASNTCMLISFCALHGVFCGVYFGLCKFPPC